MKLVETAKSYSWLQWPVTLKSCDDYSVHVTAKFFGCADIDPVEVSEILSKEIDILLLDKEDIRRNIYWSPQMFDEQNHVLEFQAYPVFFKRVHDAFSLIRDEFNPWRPHITVPMHYWELVAHERLSPKDEELIFGPIELWLGKDRG